MESKKSKVLALGVSLYLLMSMVAGAGAGDNDTYGNAAIGMIGNYTQDFGTLFGTDMPDLVIGALVLGMIVFLGVVLKKIMHKSTT